jgi:hypothetical protein
MQLVGHSKDKEAAGSRRFGLPNRPQVLSHGTTGAGSIAEAGVSRLKPERPE